MKKEEYKIGVTYVTPNTVNTGIFHGSVPRFSLRVAIPFLKLILSINAMDSLNIRLGMWTINDSWEGR
jgi:hypothetical protein